MWSIKTSSIKARGISNARNFESVGNHAAAYCAGQAIEKNGVSPDVEWRRKCPVAAPIRAPQRSWRCGAPLANRGRQARTNLRIRLLAEAQPVRDRPITQSLVSSACRIARTLRENPAPALLSAECRDPAFRVARLVPAHGAH
jgi:hypothetical protein